MNETTTKATVATPRTDAVARTRLGTSEKDYVAYVEADFARGLERENTKLRHHAKEMARLLCDVLTNEIAGPTRMSGKRWTEAGHILAAYRDDFPR